MDVDEPEGKSMIESYTGVAVKVRVVVVHVGLACKLNVHPLQVSFNSSRDEDLRVQQLSGGQKSLVALATGETRVVLVSRRRQRASTDHLTLLYSQSLPFKDAIPLHFTCSTKSMRISMRSTEPRSQVRHGSFSLWLWCHIDFVAFLQRWYTSSPKMPNSVSKPSG